MGVQTCGCADADGCKQKRKRTLTGGFRTGGWACGRVGVQACGWACSRVDMRMRMAVNKKEKGKKKKTLTNWFRACGWACGRVGVRACRWACRGG